MYLRIVGMEKIWLYLVKFFVCLNRKVLIVLWIILYDFCMCLCFNIRRKLSFFFGYYCYYFLSVKIFIKRVKVIVNNYVF